jgi:hypothetical protein
VGAPEDRGRETAYGSQDLKERKASCGFHLHAHTHARTHTHTHTHT